MPQLTNLISRDCLSVTLSCAWLRCALGTGTMLSRLGHNAWSLRCGLEDRPQVADSVAFNPRWDAEAEGGKLRCFPRGAPSDVLVGADAGNLQAGPH